MKRSTKVVKERIMKNCKVVIVAAMSAVALSFLLVGCDRQVSKTQSSSVSSDGTDKSKEKTVTEAPDGKQ